MDKVGPDQGWPHLNVHLKQIRAQKYNNIPAKHLEQRFMVLLELRKQRERESTLLKSHCSVRLNIYKMSSACTSHDKCTPEQTQSAILTIIPWGFPCSQLAGSGFEVKGLDPPAEHDRNPITHIVFRPFTLVLI